MGGPPAMRTSATSPSGTKLCPDAAGPLEAAEGTMAAGAMPDGTPAMLGAPPTTIEGPASDIEERPGDSVSRGGAPVRDEPPPVSFMFSASTIPAVPRGGQSEP